jgi:hypothetical protein
MALALPLTKQSPATADTTIAAAALAGAVLADLVFGAATTAAELKAAAEENKDTLEWIGATAPEIREQLREVYRRRSAELTAKPHGREQHNDHR